MIPVGYRILITDSTGTIIDAIDIGGYDLRNSIAAVDLAVQIADIIEDGI